MARSDSSPANTTGVRVYGFFTGLLRFVIHSTVKVFMTKMNRLMVYNRETYLQLVETRTPDRGLITFSNHYSCMDDPLIWGISSWRVIWKCSWSKMRWIPAAKEIVFTSPMKNRFFTYSRCIPVMRGDGVYQPGMDTCLEKLNQGGWVHIFPEGKVNKDKEQMRLKWGIGHLIAESDKVPIVLPMFHLGMDSVLPNRQPYRLQSGQDVTVVVGEPVDYTELVQTLKDESLSTEEIKKVITDDIQERFQQLQHTTEQLHFSQTQAEAHSSLGANLWKTINNFVTDGVKRDE